MSAPLKLYVWHDVLVDHTPGVMFALASSLEEATELIRKRDHVAEMDLGKPVKVYDEPVGFAVWGGG